MSQFMEVFTLVTGVVYIVLEIRQKNLMWAVGILTSAAAMWVFFRQGLYASFGLNTYYLVTSFVGLWQWRKDKRRLSQNVDCGRKDETGGNAEIHLNRLPAAVLLVSALAAVAGTFGMAELMKILENPMSYLDSVVTVLSAIATWWLVKSYPQQWLLWILADGLSMGLCAAQGLWWMTALYGAYALSAVYGYYHWRKNGRYI